MNVNLIMNALPSVFYVGDAFSFSVYIRDPFSASGAFAIPSGATFRVWLPGQKNKTVEVTDCTLISYGSGGVTVKVSGEKSAGLSASENPRIALIITSSEGETTVEGEAGFKIKSRPLPPPVA